MTMPGQHGSILPPCTKGRHLVIQLLISAGLGTSLAALPAWADAPAVAVPIVTAPSIRPNLLAPQEPLVGTSTEPARGTSATQDASVPSVLPFDMHPWPLRFNEQPPLNALYLTLPTEQEAKLMLPGQAADAAQQARYTVSKYISDAIGVAAQARGRQLDMLENWVTQTDKKAHQLTGDPWQAYEFSLESRREVNAFRASVAAQSTPSINRMASDANSAISRITLLINAMPTYELRMAWYGVMVQLKEGLLLFQPQVQGADAQLLQLSDRFLNDHPQAPRPAGEPPTGRKLMATQSSDTRENTTTIAAPVAESSNSTRAKPETGGSAGGLIAVGVILAGFGGIILRLRQRVRSKAQPKNNAI